MERGTGAGLAVSHRIFEAHEGRIRVDSALGKGSAFTLTLPVATAAALQAPQARAADNAGPAASLLIIDDEPEVAQMLADIPASQGPRGVTAGSGQQTLRTIEGERFDVILDRTNTN